MPKLKICQIELGLRNIEVVGEIVFKDDEKQVQTRFGPATVSWAVLEDDTGSIRLNLWREQSDRVKIGDFVRLVNAFVKVYKGEMELNIGSDGRIQVLESESSWKKREFFQSF